MTPIRIRRISASDTLAQARTPQELLTALYANRGVTDLAEVAPGLAALEPMTALRGLGQAVVLLAELVQSGGHILVVGDYDADGATGSALAVRGLKALGASAGVLSGAEPVR